MPTYVAARLGQTALVVFLSLTAVFYLFSVQLRWLPTGGTGALAHLVMPSVVLAAFFPARIARLTRSARPAQHHPQPFRGRMGRVCSRDPRGGPVG